MMLGKGKWKDMRQGGYGHGAELGNGVKTGHGTNMELGMSPTMDMGWGRGVKLGMGIELGLDMGGALDWANAGHEAGNGVGHRAKDGHRDVTKNRGMKMVTQMIFPFIIYNFLNALWPVFVPCIKPQPILSPPSNLLSLIPSLNVRFPRCD